MNSCRVWYGRNIFQRSLNPLKSGHMYWMHSKYHLKPLMVMKSLNPLKSGHMYWIYQNNDYDRQIVDVLIPLNRVICIEFSWKVKRVKHSWTSLNPLKSGHMYWIMTINNLSIEDMKVLIPLNRVICIEFIGACVVFCYQSVLIPLNRVICIE